MKESFAYPHRMTLTVRAKGTAASIDIGLQSLNAAERRFLFELVRDTHKGGSIGFGVEPGASPGESVVKLTLTRPLRASEDAPETSRATA